MTVTREVPHGTVRGYVHYRCHCEACKAARAAYQRERGENRRVGRRREQKDRAEAKLRHPCESCGALCHRESRVCHACARAAIRAQQEKVERLWAAGESLRQIALALGSTPDSVRVETVHMRRDGWDVPYRRPRGKTLA